MTSENPTVIPENRETVEITTIIQPTSRWPAASSRPNPSPATKHMSVCIGQGVGTVVGWNGSDLEVEEKGKNGNEETEKRTARRGNLPEKLKEVDVKILGLLETWGALGLGQIEGACTEDLTDSSRLVALFFNESFRYAGRFYLRLRNLEARGLVEIQRAMHARQVYKLTKLGHWALRREWESTLNHVPRTVSPTTLHHRVTSAGTGLLLSRFLGLKVQSERQFLHLIRRNLGGRRPTGFHLPDLVVTLPDGRGRCPVEVELHQKTNEAYEALWSYYRETLTAKDTLLYLTPAPSFTIRLLGIAERFGADFLFASDLTSFREACGRAAFLNFKGASFRL